MNMIEQINFKINDNVWFYSIKESKSEMKPFLSWNGDGLYSDTLLNFIKYVHCGTIKKIELDDESIKYIIQTYSLYGNPNEQYTLNQSEVFSDKKDCVENLVNKIEKSIEDFKNKMNELKEKIIKED